MKCEEEAQLVPTPGVEIVAPTAANLQSISFVSSASGAGLRRDSVGSVGGASVAASVAASVSGVSAAMTTGAMTPTGGDTKPSKWRELKVRAAPRVAFEKRLKWSKLLENNQN